MARRERQEKLARRERRMAGSKEFRDKIEEKKGTEWYDSKPKK